MKRMRADYQKIKRIFPNAMLRVLASIFALRRGCGQDGRFEKEDGFSRNLGLKAPLRRAFTLLELFIALSILLLVSGVVGWSIKGAIDRHRFQSSVDRFAVQLREMQALALSYQSDMEVEFTRSGRMISYRRMTDEPISILQKGLVSLDGVTELFFNGKRSDTLKLNVLSSGRIDPPGVLHFQQNDHDLWVDFSLPSLVKVCTSQPAKKTSTLPKQPD